MLLFIAVIAFTLVVAYVPGYTCIRVLRGSVLLAVAFAPAISMGVAGLAAVGAGAMGVRWGIVPFALAFVLLISACALARFLGVTLPATCMDNSLLPHASKRQIAGWGFALFSAVAV
ncbi:MAG: DUF6541 family protein, partial [Dermabacter sp.]|nr:DUF6541 family protein [Dermabacter sp.]